MLILMCKLGLACNFTVPPVLAACLPLLLLAAPQGTTCCMLADVVSVAVAVGDVYIVAL